METIARPEPGPEPQPADPTLDDLLELIEPGARLGLTGILHLRVDGVPEATLAAVFAAADRRHLDSFVDRGWLTIEPDPAAEAELEFLDLQRRMRELTADGLGPPLRRWATRRRLAGSAALARLLHAVW